MMFILMFLSFKGRFVFIQNQPVNVIEDNTETYHSECNLKFFNPHTSSILAFFLFIIFSMFMPSLIIFFAYKQLFESKINIYH